MNSIIDAHIHIDHYEQKDIEDIINGDAALSALIGVSFDLSSCKRNLELSHKYSKLKPAFGWHPEQKLITDNDFAELLNWMANHQKDMIAVGEVGLPYYLRKENSFDFFPLDGYLERLESFIIHAKKWKKSIVLHTVYEDAPLVCGLLEKHSLTKAHFHWFKGDNKTISRMRNNGYYISVTPDVLYKEKTRELVRTYPLEKILVETDGPWPFEGAFKGMLTHPSMLHQSIETIADIKKLPITYVYKQIMNNTIQLYQLK